MNKHTTNKIPLVATNRELIDLFEKKVDDSVIIVTPSFHNDMTIFSSVVASNILKREITYTYIFPSSECRKYTGFLNRIHDLIRQKGLTANDAHSLLFNRIKGFELPDLSHPIPWEMGVYKYKNGQRFGFMEHPKLKSKNFVFPYKSDNDKFHHLINLLEQSSSPSTQQTEREICDILTRFQTSLTYLIAPRRGKKPKFILKDEIDVQDILATILLSRFSNIQREWHPRPHAGFAHKIDFYFMGLNIALEVKTTISNSRKTQDFIKEINDYKAVLTNDDNVSVFIVFIYDPKMVIGHYRDKILRDIQSSDKRLKTIVIINP